METVVPEDGFQVVFVNPGLVVQQGRKANSLLRSMDDVGMQLQGNLGVGNHGGKKERMCVAALFAVYPNDRECDYRISKLDTTLIDAMTDQTPGMSTSAWNMIILVR